MYYVICLLLFLFYFHVYAETCFLFTYQLAILTVDLNKLSFSFQFDQAIYLYDKLMVLYQIKFRNEFLTLFHDGLDLLMIRRFLLIQNCAIVFVMATLVTIVSLLQIQHTLHIVLYANHYQLLKLKIKYDINGHK